MTLQRGYKDILVSYIAKSDNATSFIFAKYEPENWNKQTLPDLMEGDLYLSSGSWKSLSGRLKSFDFSNDVTKMSKRQIVIMHRIFFGP